MVCIERELEDVRLTIWEMIPRVSIGCVFWGSSVYPGDRYTGVVCIPQSEYHLLKESPAKSCRERSPYQITQFQIRVCNYGEFSPKFLESISNSTHFKLKTSVCIGQHSTLWKSAFSHKQLQWQSSTHVFPSVHHWWDSR